MFIYGEFEMNNFVETLNLLFRANRAQYAEVSFQSVSDENIVNVPLPSMQGEDEDDSEYLIRSKYSELEPFRLALEALSSLAIEDKPVDVFNTPTQLDGELVTLTLLPRARWQTLLNLEVIQVRHFTFILVCMLNIF